MFKDKKILLLAFAFAFRLLDGLLLYGNPSDDIQTYLSGLKYYTTGEWPFFGPCVGGSETTYVSQMPGALSGFLIAMTLKVCPYAEAPFVFFNFLNFVALVFFAWYCHKRFPKFSLFWLLAYVLFLPWVLYLTTNVNTASFIIFGSIIFFVGFFETVKELTLKIVPLPLAYAMMGFAFFWNMQMHLSWVFFIPFLMGAFLNQLVRGPKAFLKAAFFCTLGAIPTAAFLLPTLVKFGFFHLTTGKGFGTNFNYGNFRAWHTILQRYVSIANYEFSNFWCFFEDAFKDLVKVSPLFYLYYALAFLVKYLAKFVVFALLLFWFLKDNPRQGWKEFKYLTLFFFVLVWVSFWFTVKMPLTHIYHISYPIIMTYSLYCWYRFVDQKILQKAVKVVIVLAFLFQTAFPIVRRNNYIYQKRPELQAAIDQKNYHLFGERFNGAIY